MIGVCPSASPKGFRFIKVIPETIQQLRDTRECIQQIRIPPGDIGALLIKKGTPRSLSENKKAAKLLKALGAEIEEGVKIQGDVLFVGICICGISGNAMTIKELSVEQCAQLEEKIKQVSI